MHFYDQIILGELVKSCDFARDFLENRCYRRNGHSRSLRLCGIQRDTGSLTDSNRAYRIGTPGLS